MAKQWSEEFQKVSKVSCMYLSDFSPLPYSLLMECLFVSVFVLMLGLLMPDFGSRTIFFTHPLPPGQTSTVEPLLHYRSRTHTIFRSPPGWTITTWLVVWGRDRRNRAHAIKCDGYTYIHTYKCELTTLHD